MYSGCCTHDLMDSKIPICSFCKKHCDVITEEEMESRCDDFDWEKYCLENPDFDDEMNGLNKSEESFL